MESYYYYGNYIPTFPSFPQVKRGGDLGGQFRTNNFFFLFFLLFFLSTQASNECKKGPFHSTR